MAGTIVANTINTDTAGAVFTTNNALTGIAKAWVNFGYNGTTTVIAASYNVSSVTRTSTGIYTIAFTTAMPSANYSVVGTSSVDYAASYLLTSFVNFSVTAPYYVAPTASQFIMGYTYANSVSSRSDPVYACVSVLSN